MKVSEIMTAEVVTVDPDAAVNVIARLMASRGVSGVPVVEEGRVVGIVTEQDLVLRNARLDPPPFFRFLDAQIPLESPAHFEKRVRHMLGTRARDVMTEAVVSVTPDTEIEELARLMLERRVNPVPVIAGGRLVGIVSRADLIRMMARDVG